MRSFMFCYLLFLVFFFFFFFNDTATTEIYTLSLHDALPICSRGRSQSRPRRTRRPRRPDRPGPATPIRDRKSTRLNSSHGYISYAVFCLKKKKNKNKTKKTIIKQNNKTQISQMLHTQHYQVQ